MKTALTIAGFDPTGGAGIQADLKVFGSFGLYGYSVATAITAQNTTGVSAVYAVEEDALRGQLEFLMADLRPAALKTGMLYTDYAVGLVAGTVEKFGLKNLVIDPVAVSSSGFPLVREGVPDVVRDRLFPLARVVTPNMQEASDITGIDIRDEEDMQRAAVSIRAMGPETVAITGGHFRGRSVDLFHDGEGFYRFGGERVDGEYHGTGCAFSAAVTAMLALGKTSYEAVERAAGFVRSAIIESHRLGKGMGLLNL
jgi:hydroxymethylpyrimidine/phosphomethylpyrimidine kinase